MNGQKKSEIIQASEQGHRDAINLMKGFMDDGKPKVGIFWYDYADNVLFGVEKGNAELYTGQGKIITYPNSHETFWQNQHNRALTKGDTESIFYNEHNYKLIPKGRIFLERGTFYVNVGSWVNERYIDKNRLRELIIDEFNLPDNFVFRIDHD